MAIQATPVYELTSLYINGLQLSWVSLTQLQVASGQCRDSSNSIDLPIGSAPLNGGFIAAPLTITAGTSGVGGLDTGTLANNTWYGVWVLGSSQYAAQNNVVLSLATNAVPFLPTHFDSYRLIGYVKTNGSAQFLQFYQSGTGNTRYFQFDAPISVLSAGAATTYTANSLLAGMPPINSPVYLNVAFTPAAVADVVNIRPTGGTGTALVIKAAAAALIDVSSVRVMALIATGVPSIDYLVTQGTDALSLNVLGFEFSL